MEETADEAEQAASGMRKTYGAIQKLGYFDRDRVLMLETFGRAIDLAGQETPASLAEIEKLFDQADAEANRFPPKFISALMLPSVRHVPAKFAFYEARRQAALTAIAIERFRLKHSGQLPDDLTMLVPEFLSKVPEDPFDGGLLRFRKLDNGYAVYSVGRDCKDDNGLERPRKHSTNMDATFIVENPGLKPSRPPPPQ